MSKLKPGDRALAKPLPAFCGDRVTIVVAGQRTRTGYRLKHAVVTARTSYASAEVSAGHLRYWVVNDREGVQWIRGHHAVVSVEAKALLAAYLLTHS